MPSYASSSRYQSRLFNFVNQQSKRLGDRLQNSFRHLQVATTWSLEALFYPVYLLFQKAIDSAARQIQPKKEQTEQYLQANSSDSELQAMPSGDAPIQQVLQAVENLQQGLIVQGIASELVSRNLVLVSTENQTLDILTQEQQKKLQDRILIEIAKYWRDWRLTTEKNETKLLTEIDRLLTKLSSSNPRKTQALQTQTTCQGERRSPLQMQTTGYDISLANDSSIIALLDAAVAKLESNALIPVQQASSLYQAVQTQLNIFVERKEELRTPKSGRENQWSSIQSLIWEAINFFFGNPAKKHVEGDRINSYGNPVSTGTLPKGSVSDTELALPPSPTHITQKVRQSVLTKSILESQQVQSLGLESPWLSENDLFGESQPSDERENNQQLLLSSQITNPELPFSRKNLIKSYQNFFQKTKSESRLSEVKTVVNELTPSIELTKQGTLNKLLSRLSIAASLINPSQKDNHKAEILHQSCSTTEVEAKPDWIETQAKIIGYEIHPLEQILEWLDRIMLLLEEMLFKIVQFLQKRWKRK